MKISTGSGSDSPDGSLVRLGQRLMSETYGAIFFVYRLLISYSSMNPWKRNFEDSIQRPHSSGGFPSAISLCPTVTDNAFRESVNEKINSARFLEGTIELRLHWATASMGNGYDSLFSKSCYSM